MPGTSTEQVVDKGIRQKSIHSFHSIHSFPDGSAFCPGAPKRVPSDSEKHRRVYTSSNVCHSHEWRVDTASGMTLKKQNACLHAVRHAVEEKELRVYTASEAKGLMHIMHDLSHSLPLPSPPLSRLQPILPFSLSIPTHPMDAWLALVCLFYMIPFLWVNFL